MKVSILKHGTIYQRDHVFGYAGWPSITKLNDGTLACVYSGDRLAHVCPFGRVLLSKSFDEGESWGAPMTVINSVLDDRDGGIAVFGEKKDKVIITSFTNTVKFQKEYASNVNHPNHAIPGHQANPGLAFAYFDKLEEDYNVEEKEAETLGSTYVLSEDNCNTFTEVKVLPITSPHGPCVLKDGSLFYVGRAFSSDKGENAVYGKYPALKEGIYYMTSKDGLTWSEPVQIPTVFAEEEKQWTFCEPHAVALVSGRILVQMRVHIGGWHGTYQCYSDDLGKTWSKPEKIIDWGLPTHLLQLKDGRIVCSYGMRYPNQNGERAIVSENDGESWSEAFVLREGVDADLGYPATVELDDGSLLTVYYQKMQGREKTGIYYTKWKLEI